jgi:hypothetical protein
MVLLAVPRRQVPIIPLIAIFAATAVVGVGRLLVRRRRPGAAGGVPAPGAPPRVAEAPQRAPAPSQ